MGTLENGAKIRPDRGKSKGEAFRVDWVRTERIDHRRLQKFQGDLKVMTGPEKEKLRHEIETRGFTEPVTAWQDGKNLRVLNGHQRLQVLEEMQAQGLRIPKIPVNIIRAKDEREAKLKLLALTSQYGRMTGDSLQAYIKAAGLDRDLEEILASFRFPELNLRTIAHLMDKANQEGGQDTINPEAPAVVKPGDLVELGRHRLICGDSREPETLEKLMAGRKIDMVLADPPYGVDYSGKNEFLNAIDHGTRIQKEIKNDRDPGQERDYRAWFTGYFLAVRPHMGKYNTVYVFMQGPELHNLRLAFQDAGFTWHDYLIWVKNHHVLGRKDYAARHEFIMYGWLGRHKFFGGFQTTVLEYPKPAVSDLHPTMKPVDLCADLIMHGTRKGSAVFDGDAGSGSARFDADLAPEEQALVVQDGFMGSGSTMIACQRTGRLCYGAEIDPHYCDVIIDRFLTFTGQKTVKINGKEIKWQNTPRDQKRRRKA